MIAGFLAGVALADDPAPDDGSRDDEIFGPTDAPAPVEPAPAPAADDLGVDLKRTTDADIARALGAADDRLAIGGTLYLRADTYVLEDTPFEDSRFDAPSLFDVYVDGRPNDRVRVYARGRLYDDFAIQTGDTDAFGNELVPARVVLDQLWLKGDVARRLFFTVGQQRIKWGTGRFWNPTDFLNAQKLDPLAVFDVRTGVPLVKLHLPLEKYGANLYAIANFDGAHTPADVGGAVRAEVAFASTEITASAAFRRGTPLRLGGDVSTGLGPFDLHAEAAVEHGDDGPFYLGKLDFQSLTFPSEVDRSDEWIPQIVGGAELAIKYSGEDSLYLGGEFFWNDAGYTDAHLYPWVFANGAYQPFYLGREYAGIYAALPGPGQWDDTSFTASALGNLSDQSFIARLDLRQTVLTYLALNAYGAYHFGENGELHYATEIAAFPGVDAISIPAPLVDFGVGATVSF